ncbi:MAG: 50S ribosomal protein L6 [Clostridia bacterium]|nr:50S ribosomal protein L6 [Clostridia bacterium]
MSRIGRMPIVIPVGVTLTVDGDNVVHVNGKLGSLSQKVDRQIKLELNSNEVVLTRSNESSDAKAKHGLYRMLVANMVTGVSEGFKKTLIINGVGYKAQKQGNKIVLNVGYSHPVEMVEENGITFECPDALSIVVKGISKEDVGEVASKIRSIRPVEPYHAYGVRYKDEVVVRKVGKVSGKK